jgi:hypothetical protein
LNADLLRKLLPLDTLLNENTNTLLAPAVVQRQTLRDAAAARHRVFARAQR